MVARRIVTKALRLKGEGERCRKGEDYDEDDIEWQGQGWCQGR